MSSDDWGQRRQDSNRFLDRQKDLRDAEIRATERSHAIYEALGKGDHGQALWILGMDPPGAGVGASPAGRPEDLVAELRELWQSALQLIRSRSLLPASLTKDWHARLSDVDGPDYVATVEGVLQEAQEAYRNWRRYENYREVSLSLDLKGHLHLIVLQLADLRDKLRQYLSQSG
jgi:hypothetical protein